MLAVRIFISNILNVYIFHQNKSLLLPYNPHQQLLFTRNNFCKLLFSNYLTKKARLSPGSGNTTQDGLDRPTGLQLLGPNPYHQHTLVFMLMFETVLNIHYRNL